MRKENKEQIVLGPCYRHICKGRMSLEDDICFVCRVCGISVEKSLYESWVNGEIDDLENNEDETFEGIPDYDDVYDEDGEYVYCENCKAPLKYHDEQYVCPRCDTVISRKEFFEYIGAEPLGDECLTCKDNYAYCKEYCEIYSNEV